MLSLDIELKCKFLLAAIITPMSSHAELPIMNSQTEKNKSEFLHKSEFFITRSSYVDLGQLL